MKKRAIFSLLVMSLFLGACTKTSSNTSHSTTQTTKTTKTTTSTYFTKRDQDASYDQEKASKIRLEKETATVSGEGVSVDGKTVTITKAGTYVVSGESENVAIVVQAGDEDKVQIVLNGVTMTGTDAPIVVENADKTFITLGKDTTNKLSDSASHQNTQYDAVIYSKDDLTLNGEGSLTIEGNYGNAIESNDDLLITGGTYDIKGYKNALSANDAINIKEATLNLSATEDAIHADNDEDTSLGNFYLESGKITIQAGDDGIHASNTALVDGGDVTITSSTEGCGGR